MSTDQGAHDKTEWATPTTIDSDCHLGGAGNGFQHGITGGWGKIGHCGHSGWPNKVLLPRCIVGWIHRRFGSGVLCAVDCPFTWHAQNDYIG